MTKKDLSRIYCIEKEISMWEQELQKLNDESLISSPGLDGMPGGSFKPESQQEKRVIAKLTIEQTINGLYDELLRVRTELTTWIASIDDSYLRQILYHRCVQAMSWQEVCDAMSLGSSDGIRKAYDRFVIKNFPKK